jgi:hypothetical protein
VRGIHLKEGVLYPLQSKVRTAPPYLRRTILTLQISLNALLPLRPLHCDGQCILQPPRWLQGVIVHQHPEEPYRHTQCVTLYPALHPALLALPLLSALLTTFQPPSLIQKPARLLQIHCTSELLKGIRDRGSGNCNCKWCLHIDPWSQAVAASIDLVTQT